MENNTYMKDIPIGALWSHGGSKCIFMKLSSNEHTSFSLGIFNVPRYNKYSDKERLWTTGNKSQHIKLRSDSCKLLRILYGN